MNPSTLVMKFGGTSVGSPQAFRQVTEIVLATSRNWERLVLVTSAMSGVTNWLLSAALRASAGDRGAGGQTAARLRSQHLPVVEELLPPDRQAGARSMLEERIEEFSALCEAIRVLGEATPRALDTVAAYGERLCAPLLAEVLQAAGLPAVAVDAASLIVTDSEHQAAHPDLAATREKVHSRLDPLLSAGTIPLVTGFVAADRAGVTTTLGRGGSDYTAALLGAALPAEEVWIWTDVDGVMSADPRRAPRACTIPALTYRELSELAYYGAKVLHPKTIRPVVEAGIGLRICNTFNPTHPGTRLAPDDSVSQDGTIKAVTAIPRQSLVTIEGRGMLGVPGVAARAFGAVAATKVSVPLITQASSEQSICFAVPYETAEAVVSALEQAFAFEISRRDIDRVWASGEVEIVTVVGAGMRHTPGVAGRVFGTLGKQGVNVIAIAQGSSEVSISLVVDAADAGRAVQALHTLTCQERNAEYEPTRD